MKTLSANLLILIPNTKVKVIFTSFSQTITHTGEKQKYGIKTKKSRFLRLTALPRSSTTH